MWCVRRYGGRNHVCNIWWLSVKGCGCGESLLPSPQIRFSRSDIARLTNLFFIIDLTRRPYNIGHTTVWPCDYSAESWSISTALCVLNGNDKIGSFSAIVWSCCWWAPGHGDCPVASSREVPTTDPIYCGWWFNFNVSGVLVKLQAFIC